MTPADQVQSLLDQVAEGTSLVLLPLELVQQLVNKTRKPEAAPSLGPEPLGGYNLKQVGAAMGRTRARILQLVHQGHFPNAYKLLNGEWRIPASDITDFFQRQQATAVATPPVDLGRWRKQRVKQ